MKKKVYIPPWLKEGIHPLKNSYPKRPNLIVFDTETESRETGDPYLLTLYDGVKPKYLRVNPKTIAQEFMRYLLEHCPNRRSHILFAHNLQFDITAVLALNQEEIFRWKSPPPIVIQGEEGELGSVKVFPQKTWFAQVHLPSGVNVKVVDSGNFIRGSLYDISRELNLPCKKEKAPDWLGGVPENSYEWKELIRYCRAEIKAEYALAEYILGIHRRYDAGFSVSIAQLGSKIFRKRFLLDKISQTPYPVRGLAEFCIHGGRAECFTSHPAVIPDVKMYDYNSFYPWAMANLPPLTEGRWEEINEFADGYEGFYKVTGFVTDCKWPMVLKSSKGFRFAKDEYIKGLPLVSYEVREALRNEELVLEEVEGWVWVPEEGEVNPFKAFVEEFYGLKEKHRGETAQYLQYKLLLNSLYGKTYQALRMHGYDEEPELIWDEKKGYVKNQILYRAGGLYLPHVGSWITSMCRAKLHEDMHKFRAIDCATDSFKTLEDVPTGTGLGDLKFVAGGLLLMIRPKLYVMFSNEVAKRVAETGDLREFLKSVDVNALRYPEDIVKYAHHGFWGNVYQLLELYRDKSNQYFVQHMTKIRESIRQNKNPRVMETQRRSLRVDWRNEVGFCGLTKKLATQTRELCTDQCARAYIDYIKCCVSRGTSSGNRVDTPVRNFYVRQRMWCGGRTPG